MVRVRENFPKLWRFRNRIIYVGPIIKYKFRGWYPQSCATWLHLLNCQGPWSLCFQTRIYDPRFQTRLTPLAWWELHHHSLYITESAVQGRSGNSSSIRARSSTRITKPEKRCFVGLVALYNLLDKIRAGIISLSFSLIRRRLKCLWPQGQQMHPYISWFDIIY